MSGELGKASLDLDAELGPFERNVLKGEGVADSLRDTLDKLVAVANMAERSLNDVKMSGGAESRVTAQEILSGVHHISDASRDAAIEIDRVKLNAAQAAETEAAGDIIDHKLDDIRDSARRTQEALDGVKLRLTHATSGASGRRLGYGVGPFGAGYGRLGLFGTAVGLGALTAPAAAPAAIGLLASIPVFAAAAAGSLGVLALAFSGVGKAIGGDKKAFDDLTSSQKQFVLLVRSLDGWLDRLKQVAAQSLFPGLTKGLKAALSPGTVNAITTAVVQLGRSLGAAGAQWGKYFGSARFQHIFGPLMQSAARNIGKLSDTFLHLFDAIGTVARAAIPFTNWLVSAIDKGAKFADTWIHAKDATGQLAGAMNQAKDSLRLVAHLAGAVVKAVFAIGKAVYPVAKVAVKLLTQGINALGAGVRKAAPDIRGALGGALGLVAQLAKTLGPVIGTLADILLKLVGVLARALTPIIKALTPIFSALRDVFRQIEPPLAKLIKDVAHALMPAIKALVKPTADLIHALGPVLAGALKVLDPILKFTAYLIATVATAFGFVIEGAARAIKWVTKHWSGIGLFFKRLGREIVHAFEYVWYILKKGAIEAALAIVEPFSHLPSFLGGWARDAKDAMQSQLDKLHAPNMEWGGYASQAGAATGKAWTGGFFGEMRNLAAAAAAAAKEAADKAAGKHHHGSQPKPGTHAWYMKYLGYDPTTQPVYGAQPPFTKNTGSSTSGANSHLDSVLDQAKIAVENAAAGSKAWTRAIHAEENALRAEISYWAKRAHDRSLTAAQRDAALKKELEYDKQLHALQNKSVGAHLQYVLDQTKVAVANAQQGTAEWDRAVRAEEKALKAEIKYWDKRAHNRKLSMEARDAALKKELEYQRQLAALLKPIRQAAVANEMQFLQAFKAIQNQFAPNSFPMDNQSVGSKKTDTHLYDIKEEARKTNDHLSAIREQGRSSGSPMGLTLAATS